MPKINYTRENNAANAFQAMQAAYKAVAVAENEMIFSAAWDGEELAAVDAQALAEAKAALLANARGMGKLALRVVAAEENDDHTIALEENVGGVSIGFKANGRGLVYDNVQVIDHHEAEAKRAKRPGGLRLWLHKAFNAGRE